MARIFDEKFETSPGRDESWSETAGTGSTIDDDANPSDVSSPSGWGSECCKFVSTGNDSYIHTDLGQEADTWSRVEFVLTAESLGAFNIVQHFIAWSDGWIAAYKVEVRENGSNELELRLECSHTGSATDYYYLSNPISLNTLYRVEVKWDATNNVWAWRVNGVDQPNDQDGTAPITSEGTLTNTHATDIGQVRCGLENPAAAMTVYFDLIAFDDADWVGEESVEGDVYNESLTEIASLGNPMGLQSIYGIGMKEGLSMGEVRQPRLKYELSETEISSLGDSLAVQLKYILIATEICSLTDALASQTQYGLQRQEELSVNDVRNLTTICNVLIKEKASIWDGREASLKYGLNQNEIFSLTFSLLPQLKYLLAKTEVSSIFASVIPQLKYQLKRIEISSLLAILVPRLIYRLLQEEEISLADAVAGILTAYFKQEGFRWRNDDGDEIAASWRQVQDVDDSIGKTTNIRLRVIVDARGNPDTTQLQLEYKESSDPASEWRKVPIS